MPALRGGVDVRWDEGIRNLRKMEEAPTSSEDGICLNLEYNDYGR